jgi:hypothetical protein
MEKATDAGAMAERQSPEGVGVSASGSSDEFGLLSIHVVLRIQSPDGA